MGHTLEDALIDAGCTAEQAGRLAKMQANGNTDDCLRMLRCHRCELVSALHEAQRPIDVCDWIIRELQLGSLMA